MIYEAWMLYRGEFPVSWTEHGSYAEAEDEYHALPEDAKEGVTACLMRMTEDGSTA